MVRQAGDLEARLWGVMMDATGIRRKRLEHAWLRSARRFKRRLAAL